MEGVDLFFFFFCLHCMAVEWRIQKLHHVRGRQGGIKWAGDRMHQSEDTHTFWLRSARRPWSDWRGLPGGYRGRERERVLVLPIIRVRSFRSCGCEYYHSPKSIPLFFYSERRPHNETACAMLTRTTSHSTPSHPGLLITSHKNPRWSGQSSKIPTSWHSAQGAAYPSSSAKQTKG